MIKIPILLDISQFCDVVMFKLCTVGTDTSIYKYIYNILTINIIYIIITNDLSAYPCNNKSVVYFLKNKNFLLWLFLSHNQALYGCFIYNTSSLDAVRLKNYKTEENADNSAQNDNLCKIVISQKYQFWSRKWLDLLQVVNMRVLSEFSIKKRT